MPRISIFGIFKLYNQKKRERSFKMAGNYQRGLLKEIHSLEIRYDVLKEENKELKYQYNLLQLQNETLKYNFEHAKKK